MCEKIQHHENVDLQDYSLGLYILKLQEIFQCETYSEHKSYQSNLQIDD